MFGFGQAAGAHGAPEEAAVTWIQDDSTVPQGGKVPSGKLFLEGYRTRVDADSVLESALGVLPGGG